MGPTTLFDKSFLQSLNLDESIWFDHFFISNICPIFYIETLADLEKNIKKGRPQEKVVGDIALKFPDVHGMPNVFHWECFTHNLVGQQIPMTGQIFISQGRPVKVAGKTGVVVERTPEAEAFSRWQKHDFLFIERNFAHIWRRHQSNLDLTNPDKGLDALGFTRKPCRSIEEVKEISEEFVNTMQEEQLISYLLLTNVHKELIYMIIQKWRESGKMPLSEYAPYAAYIMTIDIFFLNAIRAGYISGNRQSNAVDMSYLYYLPFSMVFVSSDKLHRRCAPLFMRSDQEFVWGLDLKADLRKIDDYYRKFPEEEKNKGIITFAPYPPESEEFMVSQLWEHHLHTNRRPTPTPPPPKDDASRIVKDLNQFSDAPSLRPEEIDFDISNPDAVMTKHLVPIKKGSWYILPKDTKPEAY